MGRELMGSKMRQPVEEHPAQEMPAEPMLHWIEVTDDHKVLPIGGASGQLNLRRGDDGWRVIHTALAGTSTLASGLLERQAVRFAEGYCRAAYRDISLTAREAGWRDDPASDLQIGRLMLLLGVVELPAMTAGEASDRFQGETAKRRLLDGTPVDW